LDASSIRGLIVIIALFVLNILLTTGYSALINVSKTRLRERSEEGDRGARRALHLGENSKDLLALHQFVSILLTVFIAAVAVIAFLPGIEDRLIDVGLNDGAAQVIGLLILMPIFSSLLLIFAERVPIGMVMGRAETVAIISARPLQVLVNILGPFIFLNLRISKTIAQMLGGTGVTQLVTEEEIKTIVDAGSEEGVLEDEEKEMIYSVIRFGDTLAREVMLPRIDIVALNIESTLDDALDTIITKGHSRIPVYRDNIDNIEGTIYAKDLLEVWHSGKTLHSLEGLLREPYFVPESKKASDLLIEMQNRKIHMVFVVDEYGGTAGLVTLEDLVEEIIGEVQDEYDYNEERLKHQIDANTYIFSARIDLDDMNHLLDVSIPTDESDTLGGYIFSELGRVPIVGDVIVSHDLEITVQSVTGRRIRKVKVHKISRPETGKFPTDDEHHDDTTPDTPQPDNTQDEIRNGA
jgi:CBS domain containing-hemolysin-like protein